MRRPELLAPAGDLASLEAALAAGADAVYFGLDDGFNARARAANFDRAGLAATAARVRRAGARSYLTLNTLVFEPELPLLEAILRDVAAAGIDAIIVQDPAVALLARALCPALEVHASTQMTISSAEGARFAAGLGATRVVVPRELSVAEIRRLAGETSIELEVFIHGALCVSWSGQCLTSEAWGGRSANRGQCAQSCRMPYQLVVDGVRRELGEVEYLLSPKDLAGVHAVSELAAAGVHGLKIEGRQKGPAYVATAAATYRALLDGGALPERALEELTLTYSRGFSHGFLAGSDHQGLVEGRFPKHRGAYLGRVVGVDARAGEVVVERDEEGRPWTGALAAVDEAGDAGAAREAGPVGAVAAPLPGELEVEVEPVAGMGVGFDCGTPEQAEPGGPLFRVSVLPRSRGRAAGWRLGFGQPGPDLGRVEVGHRVWLTSDPALARRAQKVIASEPAGRNLVKLEVSGRAGEALLVTALVEHPRGVRLRARASSASVLAAARGAGLDAALLEDKLGALGGTPFKLAGLDCAGLEAGLFVPTAELKEVRRALVAELSAALERGPLRVVEAAPALPRVRAELAAQLAATEVRTAAAVAGDGDAPELLVLCRTDAQLEAAIAVGQREVELDWMELEGLGRAVARARAAGLGVTLATMRVQKPGEEGYDARLARLAPDAVLVRHWGALMAFREGAAGAGGGGVRPALHGDFSLNVTNSLTAAHLFALGLDTLTAAHDLDAAQLEALLAAAPARRFTIALHHHIATFHTEHCVYSHLLSNGRDFKSCGRPCEKHEVALTDHVGLTHPVVVDVGCRNTVFNAQAQSAASLVPRLLARGVRRFRVELVRESHDEATRVLAAYRELLDGRITPAEAVRRVGVHEQFGVTRGTMKVLAG